MNSIKVDVVNELKVNIVSVFINILVFHMLSSHIMIMFILYYCNSTVNHDIVNNSLVKVIIVLVGITVP